MPEAATPVRETPVGADEAAALLRDAAEAGRAVRFTGGGSKLGWGNPVHAQVELSTLGLGRILEYDPGDLTAVVEAGVRFEQAQEAFAAQGQRLALDPPGHGATIGGILATADSGPLRHRYGAARDLVLGATVALPDGTVARSGGKVIKNVAGYDLAKLMCGAFGTLGLIAQVALRLHPLPPATATLVERFTHPSALAARARELASAPLELESLDVCWDGGDGALLARFAGAAAGARAAASSHGRHAEVVEADEELWAAQRARQRAAGWVGDGMAVLRVSALPSELELVLGAAAAAGGQVVGRAALGVSWIALPEAAVAQLRAALAPRACVLVDGPQGVERWGGDPGAAGLMLRVKERFDPAGVCNPGVMAGGVR